MSFIVIGMLMLREGFNDIVTIGLSSSSMIAQSWLGQDMLRKFFIEKTLNLNAEDENPTDFDEQREMILTQRLEKDYLQSFLE